MDSSLTPNPVVLFASFLIIMTYVCNKVLKPRYRSSDDEKYHEQYILEHHYPNHTQHPQYESRNRNLNGNQASPEISREPQDNFIFQDEPLSPGPDGWPSRDHDMALSDKLSAINTSTNMKGPSLSLNNSFFDQTNPRTFGLDREDMVQERPNGEMIPEVLNRDKNSRTEVRSPRQFYSPNFPKASNLNNPTQGAQKLYKKSKQSTLRRGPIYQDSSDTDAEIREPSVTQKGNRSPRGKNYRDESPNGMNVEGYAVERRMNSISSERRSKNKVNESGFEPEVIKKRQLNPGRTNDIELEGSSNRIKAQEIFDFSSKGSSKKKGHQSSGKTSKDSRFLKTTRDSEGPTYSGAIEDGHGSKKIKSGKSKLQEQNGGIRSLLEDSDSENKLKANPALRRELLKRGISTDLSYLTEFGANLSLKKYVAKKMVQEQAFRISDSSNAYEPKKVTSTDLFISKDTSTKQPEVQGQTQTQEKTDLFKNLSSGSGLFNKVDSDKSKSVTPEESKASSQELPGLSKREIPSSQDQSSQGQSSQGQSSQVENKPPGLFANLNSTQNKTNDTVPKNQENAANTQPPPQKSVFSNSGLFSPSNEKASAPPSVTSTNNNQTSIDTKNESNPKPGSLFQQSANKTTPNAPSLGLFSTVTNNTTSQLFGPPKTDSKKQSADQQPEPDTGTLSANVLAPSNEVKGNNGQVSESKPESIPGFFSQQSNIQPNSNNQAKETNQQTNSLFNTQRGEPNHSNPPPSPPPKKDEFKPNLFSTNTSSNLSGLFGPSKTNTSPEKLNSNNAANPFPSNDSKDKEATKGLFSSFNTQSNNQPSAPANLGSNWLNQNANDKKPPEGTSFLNALKQPTESSANETQPKSGNMFSNLFQASTGSNNINTGSTGSSLFGPKNPSKGPETENQMNALSEGNNNSGIPKPSGLFSSLINTENTKTSTGLFANLNAGSSGGNNAGGLFANLNKNNNGGGIFGNNNSQNGGTSGLFGTK